MCKKHPPEEGSSRTDDEDFTYPCTDPEVLMRNHAQRTKDGCQSKLGAGPDYYCKHSDCGKYPQPQPPPPPPPPPPEPEPEPETKPGAKPEAKPGAKPKK